MGSRIVVLSSQKCAHSTCSLVLASRPTPSSSSTARLWKPTTEGGAPVVPLSRQRQFDYDNERRHGSSRAHGHRAYSSAPRPFVDPRETREAALEAKTQALAKLKAALQKKVESQKALRSRGANKAGRGPIGPADASAGLAGIRTGIKEDGQIQSQELQRPASAELEEMSSTCVRTSARPWNGEENEVDNEHANEKSVFRSGSVPSEDGNSEIDKIVLETGTTGSSTTDLPVAPESDEIPRPSSDETNPSECKTETARQIDTMDRVLDEMEAQDRVSEWNSNLGVRIRWNPDAPDSSASSTPSTTMIGSTMNASSTTAMLESSSSSTSVSGSCISEVEVENGMRATVAEDDRMVVEHTTQEKELEGSEVEVVVAESENQVTDEEKTIRSDQVEVDPVNGKMKSEPATSTCITAEAIDVEVDESTCTISTIDTSATTSSAPQDLGIKDAESFKIALIEKVSTPKEFEALLDQSLAQLWTPPLRAGSQILAAILEKLPLLLKKRVSSVSSLSPTEGDASEDQAQLQATNENETSAPPVETAMHGDRDVVERQDKKDNEFNGYVFLQSFLSRFVTKINPHFVRDSDLNLKIRILKQLVAVCDSVGDQSIVPRSIFAAFMEIYADYLATDALQKPPQQVMRQARGLIETFRRFNWSIPEKMSLYRYANSVATAQLDVKTAIWLLHHLLESRSYNESSVQQLLRIVMHSSSAVCDIRALKYIEMMLRLDATDIGFDHNTEMFLTAVRDWDYTAPIAELETNDCRTLHQLAHFLGKHGFPGDHTMVGPYALPLCHVQWKTAVFTKLSEARNGKASGPSEIEHQDQNTDDDSTRDNLTSRSTSTTSYGDCDEHVDGRGIAEEEEHDAEHISTLDVERTSNFAAAGPFQSNMRKHLRSLGWRVLEVCPEYWAQLGTYSQRAAFVRALLKTEKLLS
ncbi:unnamed protein product [Amoebophrya sp. A25]|nr:unnamed protein product [Amoebophrya sp. A25]|eukprot:GSA25T00000328001.1